MKASPPCACCIAGMALLASMVTAGTPAPARADAAYLDIRRYVFVPGADVSVTTVIDADADRVVGALQTGIVARQVEVSRELAKLVATDGGSASISILDVFGGTARQLALPAPAQRLTLGTRGRILAAIDLTDGTINLIDLGAEKLTATIANLPALRDVMFGDADILLYIAAEGTGGIGVIDVDSAKLVGQIPTFHPTQAGVATMARLPNGRRVLAAPQGGGPISVLDLEQGKAIGELDAGPDTAAAVPSGTGTYLLVPNTLRPTLAVFRGDTLRDPVSLQGEAGGTRVLQRVARQRRFHSEYDATAVAGVRPRYTAPRRRDRAAGPANSRSCHLRQPQALLAGSGSAGGRRGGRRNAAHQCHDRTAGHAACGGRGGRMGNSPLSLPATVRGAGKRTP